MTPEQYLAATTTASDAFGRATGSALDTPIEFLGDWQVRDLVAHLGAVYSMVIANVQASGSELVRPGAEAKAPEDDTIVAWFAERRETLLSTLAAADAEAPTATFAGPQTNGWWMRRMAHETGVHRWDADAAIVGVADTPPIDGDLATDGINEYLTVSLQVSTSRPNRLYPPESLHLHRTDGPGEWMLVGNGEGSVTITEEHGKGDAAVRGSASNLQLWMWNRPVTDIEIFGDEAVAAAWRALAP